MLSLKKPQNEKSQKAISAERANHAVGKWLLITHASRKRSLSNCFAWRWMWEGAQSCMNMMFSRYPCSWSYGVQKSLAISWYCCPVTEQIWISFAFYLSKNIWSNDKGVHKTTPYCHFFQMQEMFLDRVKVFPYLNLTARVVNLSIVAKVSFVTLQNVPQLIDVNHHPSNELKHKSFTNLWVPILQYLILHGSKSKIHCKIFVLENTAYLMHGNHLTSSHYCREWQLASTTVVATFSMLKDEIFFYPRI